MNQGIGVRNHLRGFIEDKINQKVVEEKKLENYRKQEQKYRERGIDQSALISNAESAGQNDRIDYLLERRNDDVEARNRVVEVMNKIEERIENMTFETVGHLEELYEIELGEGGFVSHRIGAGDNVSFNRDSRFIYFFQNGRAEIPIASRLDMWEDVSQLRIIRKAGV